MPRQTRPRKTRPTPSSSPGPRPTAHKYPVDGDVKSYLIRGAPRKVLVAAQGRARTEGKSLRVALIEFLEDYGKRSTNNRRASAETEVSR